LHESKWQKNGGSMDLFKKLETKRIIIDKLKFDLDKFQDIFTEKELIEFYGHENLSEHENPLWDANDGDILWHLIVKETDELIGTVQLHSINKNLGLAKLGYITAKKFKLQGYMYEAIVSILEYAFTELNFRMIYAHTHEKNIPSRKLLEKLGLTFKSLGANKPHCFWGDGNEAIYVLKKKTWQENR